MIGRVFARFSLALVLLTVLAARSQAHELTDNRANLVLRAPNHLSLTLFIDYTAALQRVLAPKAGRTEFVLAMAAMEESEFRRQVNLANERLQSATRLTVNGKADAPPLRWAWPDSTAARQRFRQQAMAATVGTHEHDQPSEVRADARWEAPIESATIRFSREFGRVLVVWYRPRQVWTDAGREATMRFD